MPGRPWTQDELILAFNLYLKLPFGQLHRGNPEVKKLAELLDRSANSIAMRLGNFAACDPHLKQRGIKGLPGGIKQCQPVWNEYNYDPEEFVFQSERLLARISRQTRPADNQSCETLNPEGKERLAEVKTRVNQQVFRKIVLGNYEGKCAVSGIDLPELLIASHIIPWAECARERLNPTNGICLSSLYDRAFDQGLIAFGDDLRLQCSPRLRCARQRDYFQAFFAPYENKPIREPADYPPEPEFLKWHRENIFLASTC